MRKAFLHIVLFLLPFFGTLPTAAQQIDTTATKTVESRSDPLLPDSGEISDFPPPQKPVFVPDSVEQPQIEPDTIAIVPESDSAAVLLSVPYDDTSQGAVPESQILEPDTSYRFWTDPFWGIGIGWTLGGMPTYEAWQRSLFEEAADLPAFTDWVDSIPIRFAEITTPDEYHTAFPIGMTFVPFISENSYSAIDLNFRFMTKTQKLRWESDSIAVDFWNRERKLRYFDGSIGLTTHLGIHPRYFSVKEVDRTSLVLGASFSPLSLVQLSHEDATPFLDTAFSASDRYYGVGASWKIGLSTLRQTSPGRGLEIGTMYTGLWRGSYSGEKELTWGRLDTEDASAFDPVRFVTHRFHLYVRLLFGKKPPKIPGPATATDTTDTFPLDTAASDTIFVDTSVVDTGETTAPAPPAPESDSVSDTTQLPNEIPSDSENITPPPAEPPPEGSRTLGKSEPKYVIRSRPIQCRGRKRLNLTVSSNG